MNVLSLFSFHSQQPIEQIGVVWVNFLPNIDNLRGLILHYFAELKAGSNGEYQCPQCQDFRNVMTTMDLIEPPKVLVVALRRLTNVSGNWKKISRCIKIGGTVTLKAKDGTRFTYELVSAVKHVGVYF